MKPGTNSLKYKKDKQTLSYTYKKIIWKQKGPEMWRENYNRFPKTYKRSQDIIINNFMPIILTPKRNEWIIRIIQAPNFNKK